MGGGVFGWLNSLGELGWPVVWVGLEDEGKENGVVINCGDVPGWGGGTEEEGG